MNIPDASSGRSRGTSFGVIAAILGGLICYSFHLNQYIRIGQACFPLDDAWIHLTLAQNLARHGSFTYFPGAAPTAGSTSPLFTLLEAAGFLITSWGHATALFWCMGSYMASLWIFHRLAERFAGTWPKWATFATLLFLLDGRLAWSARSGMETTLFILLLLICLLLSMKNTLRYCFLAGLACGATFWTRPEALAMAGLILIRIVITRDGGVPLWKRIVGFAVPHALLLAGYAALNLKLGGHVLPNSFYAKGVFYQGFSRLEYLKDVFLFFLRPHILPFLPFFILECVRTLGRLLKGRLDIRGIACLFPIALIAAHTWRIPLLFERGRYIQPAIPFVMLGGWTGLLEMIQRLTTGPARVKNAAYAIVAVTVMASLFMLKRSSFEYQADCRYIFYRHVMTALWVSENVPEGDVIAAHDVGALGYLGGRRIVDLAGLVTPEAGDLMGRPDEQAALLEKEGVSWFVVALDWERLIPLIKILPREHMFPPMEDFKPPFRPMEVFRIEPGRRAEEAD